MICTPTTIILSGNRPAPVVSIVQNGKNEMPAAEYSAAGVF